MPKNQVVKSDHFWPKSMAIALHFCLKLTENKSGPFFRHEFRVSKVFIFGQNVKPCNYSLAFLPEIDRK